jgi:hypothetical protein
MDVTGFTEGIGGGDGVSSLDKEDQENSKSQPPDEGAAKKAGAGS